MLRRVVLGLVAGQTALSEARKAHETAIATVTAEKEALAKQVDLLKAQVAHTRASAGQEKKRLETLVAAEKTAAEAIETALTKAREEVCLSVCLVVCMPCLSGTRSSPGRGGPVLIALPAC
jgi:hypothetical protein